MSLPLKSVEILDSVKAEIRARMGSMFKTIEDYGGDFGDEEIGAKSFVSPAAFTTCLGWRKAAKGSYVGGKFVWEARFAVFIVTKHSERAERMREAMVRAEMVSRVLQAWSQPPCVGRPEGLMAENLYNRKLDTKGLALWMVAWWQEAEFNGTPSPDEIPAMDAVGITSEPTVSVQDPPREMPDLTVEHEIKGVTNGNES